MQNLIQIKVEVFSQSCAQAKRQKVAIFKVFFFIKKFSKLSKCKKKILKKQMFLPKLISCFHLQNVDCYYC